MDRLENLGWEGCGGGVEITHRNTLRDVARFIKSTQHEERPHAAKQIIEALEEANKERTKQISALIDTLQETVEAMPEDANQQGVMDAIETLKGFLGWAL